MLTFEEASNYMKKGKEKEKLKKQKEFSRKLKEEENEKKEFNKILDNLKEAIKLFKIEDQNERIYARIKKKKTWIISNYTLN